MTDHHRTINGINISNDRVDSDTSCELLDGSTKGFQHEQIAHDLSSQDVTGKEVKYLREMSLLNLDVIQKQYELIQKQDKQIKTLKSEKEALKCRLERMERRMSLLRQHQEVQENLTKQISPALPVVQPATQEKGKRKSSFEPQNLTKKFASCTTRERRDSVDSANSSRSTQSKHTRGDVLKNSRGSKAKTPTKHVGGKSPAQEEVIVVHAPRSSRFRHLSPEEKNTNNNARTDRGKSGESEEAVLRTDFSYYSPTGCSSKPELRSKKFIKEKVEVPTWKVVTYTNCYQLEGTENLEDEIFLKRHLKPEKEEVRRKRWDMQRLREQRAYEKLQQGRYASKLKKQIKEEDREPETFVPKLEDAQFIEVNEQIPVTAFGYPIPSIDNCEFGLPWCGKTSKTDKSKWSRRR